MIQFTRVGKIVRAHRALRIEIDGREACGEQIIGAAAVSDLLSGRRAEINFVQTPTPDRVFIGFSGEAWVSRSGRAVTLRIEGVIYSSPIAQVRQVVAGTRTAALLSRPAPAPIIDADRVQRDAIDADLCKAGF